MRDRIPGKLVSFAAAGAVAALGCALSESSASGAQPTPRFLPAEHAPASPTTHADDLVILRDIKADPAARSAACRRLLAALDDATQKNLSALLSPAAEPTSTQDLIIREMEASPFGPGWVLQPLSDLLRSSPSERKSAILRACGSIRTRESVRLLLTFTTADTSPGLRDAAFTSLARLTGRADLGSAEDAWTRWFSAVQWLPEHEWRRTLAEGLAQRADDLAAERASALHRLVESERQRSIDAATSQERSAILASLLTDDYPELRRLGIELANRELANARTLSGAVGVAALVLLSDPSPEFRLASAGLIDRLVPPGAGQAAAEALVRETEPLVAAALLRQVQRSPITSTRQTILHWLESSGPALTPAIDATAALLAAGLLNSPQDRQAVLAVVRAIPPAELPPGGLRLLLELGDDKDRAAVALLLSSPDSVVRLRTAQAVSSQTELIDEIVAAARSDTALYAPATAAITRFRPNPAGFRSLAELPAPTPEARTAALVAFAEKLSDGEIISVTSKVADPALRELLLARFAIKSLGPRFGPDHVGGTLPGRFWLSASELDNFPTVAGMLRLARTRLEVHKPAGALTLLDALEPVADQIDPRLLTSLRVEALICVNRLAEAESMDSPLADWLDGLALSTDLPHAPAILRAIDDRFESLTPVQSERLEALRAKVEETSRRTSGGADQAPPEKPGDR
jgi:hypothetical protein